MCPSTIANRLLISQQLSKCRTPGENIHQPRVSPDQAESPLAHHTVLLHVLHNAGPLLSHGLLVLCLDLVVDGLHGIDHLLDVVGCQAGDGRLETVVAVRKGGSGWSLALTDNACLCVACPRPMGCWFPLPY